MTCINRNIELKAKKLLEMFPVIVILGARQVGKTTFSKQIGLGWKYIDLEDLWLTKCYFSYIWPFKRKRHFVPPNFLMS